MRSSGALGDTSCDWKAASWAGKSWLPKYADRRDRFRRGVYRGRGPLVSLKRREGPFKKNLDGTFGHSLFLPRMQGTGG